VETDKRAIRALAAAGKPLLVTSGTLLLRHGQVGNEDDVYSTSAAPFHVRGESEELAKALGGVVVRLAPVVHGDNDAQFLPRLIAVAREKGISVYVGDGRNRWPAVHVRDAAVAYRLAVEKGVRQGSTLHVVAEGGVPVRDIAAAIGEKLGVPVGTRTAEDAAAEYFGWFASVVGTDNPVESARTKEVLGWRPTQRGLIDDLRDGNYFN
jgi:nucleoside-diphosphate-sugar epimerase